MAGASDIRPPDRGEIVGYVRTVTLQIVKSTTNLVKARQVARTAAAGPASDSHKRFVVAQFCEIRATLRENVLHLDGALSHMETLGMSREAARLACEAHEVVEAARRVECFKQGVKFKARRNALILAVI